MFVSLIALLALSPSFVEPIGQATEQPPQSASAPAAIPGPGPAIKYDLPTDGVLTLVAGTAAILLSKGPDGTLQGPLSGCRWCDISNGGAASLNGFDRFGAGARWGNFKAADDASDYVKFGIMATAILPHVRRKSYKEAGVVLEALATTTAITVLVKRTARRARPFTHDPVGAGVVVQGAKSDNNWSFFSGHTSSSFAVVAASRKIAALRGDTKAKRWWTYAGFGSAGLVGYLRIAAGRHYLTDVLTGAAVGTAVGSLIPRAASKGTATLSVSPMPGAQGLLLTAIW